MATNRGTKVVVFDFDGVFVLDSDGIYKPEGWAHAFQSYRGRYLPLLMKGNKMFGSGKPGGRIEIMEFMFRGLGEPEAAIPDLVAKAAQVFDDHVQARIKEAGLNAGALEMLQTLKHRGLALYLNSGTQTKALETSARNLGIIDYFNGIFGSTQSKLSNLIEIARREGVLPTQILVVGDGDSDYKAATEFGCPFLGYSNEWNGWEDEATPFADKVDDLRRVVEFV